MAKKRKKPQQQKSQTQPKSNLPATSSALDYLSAAKEAQSLVRSIDRKVKNSVPKGLHYDWLNNASYNNIVYPRDKIPDRILRLVESRNGIVGSIITLRIQQAIEYSNISVDKDVPGWEFALKSEDETMTPERKKQKEFLEDFIEHTHRSDYTDIEHREVDFGDLITKYIRDRILIDKVVWEIERDRKGQAVALWTLDGATILPVLPGGFYGSTSQIGVGLSSGYSKISEAIRKARLENIPPVEEIAFVQELLYGSTGGGIVAAFRNTDIIYDLSNELNDIRYYRQGLSVTEKANIAITAFINSITFNSNGLARGAIPKIAIAMGKESGYTQEQLEDAQDEWAANFSAMDGQWNIPLLNADAKILPLYSNNRDMEYQKFMEFMGALTCSIMGADSAEIGLRLNQAQSVMSENQDAKQLFSKNRGLRELLNGFSYTINKFVDRSGYDFGKDWRFRFNGLNTTDKSFEADLRKKSVETIKTIDEVRAEEDLPPLPNGEGAIILNPVFMQAKQAAAMEQQQGGMEGGDMGEDDGGFGGFSDEDADSMADDAMEDLGKAVRLI